MQTHKKLKARILSLALSAAMVTTMMPATVFAAEGDVPLGASSITECHPAHDEDCGYLEAVESVACSHLNEDGTYSCAPIEDEDEASPSDAKKDYVCSHTDVCGYVETIEGVPCNHSCELCEVKDSGDVLGSGKQEQPECICETKCFAGEPELELEAAINLDCPVCGTENADLEQCQGVAPMVGAMLLSGMVSDFSTLSSKISSASSDSANPTIIEIGGNFDLTAAITINGKHVKLTSASGSACTLTRGNGFIGIPFSVSNGGSLTLENIVIDGNKNNTSSAGVLIDVSGSKLTLDTGAVLQNNKNSAIEMYKANACVTMNGGEITGNAVTGNGGAIRFTNSAATQFIMNGGEISGNTATGDGGAIYDGGWDANPTVIIAGGEIKNNTANGNNGGAIHSSCTLQISGGTISGNAAPNGKSGGIYKTSSGGFTMTDGTIKENTAGTEASKNIYMLSNSTTTLTVGGSATIPDGLVLDAKSSGAKYINVSSMLSGQIVFSIAASSAVKTGDVAVKGSGYALTEADKTHLTYTGGAFGFNLDTVNNYFKLVTPDGVPEKDPSKARIYARGTALILAAGSSNSNYTVIYLDKNSNGTIDEGDVIWAPSSMDKTIAGNNLLAYDFIGGSYKEDLTGTTKITMLGGKITSIFGGGSSAKVTGNTSVTVSGGTVSGSVYGGGLFGAIAGDTSVTISGGEIMTDVFGGGQGGAGDPSTTSNTHVSITGGKVRMVYGGGAYQTDTAASTAISISGGEITDDVYGGGAGAAVTNQAKITVTDGKVVGNIYGSTYQAGTVGSTDITITGGTVVKSVYPRYASATVTGDKKITVGGTAKIGSISAPYIFGVCFNGGSTTNGVSSFVIAPDLGDGASINVNLPSGFKPVENPIIATEAVTGDAAKLHLVGAGATGLETYFDSSDSTVKVRFTTAVSKVTVAPDKWIIVPGGTKQFAATIEGTGNPVQTVTWTVSGNSDAGTAISTGGLLTVAPGETAATLTVAATSTADTDKSGTATVTLQHLTGIRVTAQPTKTTYVEGASFDKTGMTVEADFVENSGGEAVVHEVITDYTVSPSGALSVGDTKVTISYTVGSVTKTAEVTITVNAKVNAAVPVITTDLSTKEVTYVKDATATALNATSTVTDGGTLSYEWYSNSTNNTSGATKLNITTAAYTPSTTSTGTTYYYCVVTNTISDNNDGGTKTATTTSSVAKITVHDVVFVPVTGISSVPTTATAGTPLTLTGTVAPANATNKTIVWSVKSAGITGATISGSTLNTTAAGTVTVTATITNGLTASSNYTKDFTITVSAAFVPVTDITSVPTTATAGTPLTLSGTVAPTTATNKTIVWSVKSAGSTGATISGSSLTTTAAGTVTVTATITNGLTASSNYTKDFTITVSAAAVDKTALNNAISAANTLKGTVIVSDSAASSVQSGQKFVNAAAMEAFTNAIAAAQAVANNPNATAADISAAVTALNNAVTAFNTAIKTGTYTGGSSGGGGGGNDSPAPAPSTKPTENVSGSSNTTATVDDKGNATTTVTDKNISDAVKAAKEAANKKGVNAGEVTAVINVTSPANSNPNTVTVNLPKTVQQQVINGKIGNLAVVIDKPDIAISMNLATITEINKQANSDVQLSATRMDNGKLTGEAKAAIGNRPTFDLKATYANGSKAITSFGTGSVSVAIPYTLQAGEVAGGLYAVYIDGNGKANYITGSSYDANAKMLRFATNHFSVYGIGYKAPVGFTDIAGHWAKTDIEFVANRGLMSGTSNTTFAPNGSMTRGMFVTALGRLAGVDTNSYKTSKFTDVKTDAYYAPYVNWAAEKGITNGTTATTFSPDNTVTRQEMAVFMSNYAKAMGYKVPETRAAVTFADNSSIGGWAAAAVKQMQMAGVLNGKNGNKFDPTGTATRAEVAAVLHRYVELVIDRSTAQGLDTNDSGSAMMYENGKAVKSASRKVGDNTYNFNANGEAALLADNKV